MMPGDGVSIPPGGLGWGGQQLGFFVERVFALVMERDEFW
jgi:hypothetical protein